MPDKSRAALLMVQMAASAAVIDGLIARARGAGPKAEPKPPEGLGSGSRAYVVADWTPTCSRCSGRGKCGDLPRQCGRASWFPVFHRVTLTLADGAVVGAVCREGRRGDGGPCRKEGCQHVARAIDALAGREARGVELSTVLGAAEGVPKCPNCRERWGVTARGGGEFECRSPVCARDGRPWVFREGDTSRPPPMRHGLSIMDREPGRVVVARK